MSCIAKTTARHSPPSARGVRAMILGAALAGAVLASVGCYAEPYGTIPPPEYAYGYAPTYYDGYVVYYDDGGRPFYYVNGAVVWVPPTVAAYPGLVAHWRAHGPAYRDWHAHVGPTYRGYRFHGHR
jgi:hypothetical protein